MGSDTTLGNFRVKINATVWLDARTGRAITELTKAINDFIRDAQEDLVCPPPAPMLVRFYINARVRHAWAEVDYAFSDSSTADGPITLDRHLLVYRYADPEFGAVAIVIMQTCSGRHSQSVAYADTTTNPAAWHAYDDVTIRCPKGHVWHHRAGSFSAPGGSPIKPVDLFPTGHVVTPDTDPYSPTDWRIDCPAAQCGARCDVEVTGP
jgi:hypothetical protein